MRPRKRQPDVQEGPEAAWRFEHAMQSIIRVTKTELDAREAEYQQSRRSKSRPGPKRTKK
jgi:hypothetical protein